MLFDGMPTNALGSPESTWVGKQVLGMAEYLPTECRYQSAVLVSVEQQNNIMVGTYEAARLAENGLFTDTWLP